MFIKPAPGLKVRDPITKALVPDSGIEVPDSDLYWHRRLRDGDVLRVPPPASPTSSARAGSAEPAAVPDRSADA